MPEKVRRKRVPRADYEAERLRLDAVANSLQKLRSSLPLLQQSAPSEQPLASDLHSFMTLRAEMARCLAAVPVEDGSDVVQTVKALRSSLAASEQWILDMLRDTAHLLPRSATTPPSLLVPTRTWVDTAVLQSAIAYASELVDAGVPLQDSEEANEEQDGQARDPDAIQAHIDAVARFVSEVNSVQALDPTPLREMQIMFAGAASDFIRLLDCIQPLRRALLMEAKSNLSVLMHVSARQQKGNN
eukprot:gene12440-8529_t